jgi:hypothetical protein
VAAAAAATPPWEGVYGGGGAWDAPTEGGGGGGFFENAEETELEDELVAVEVERPSPAPPTLRLAWTSLAMKGADYQLKSLIPYEQKCNRTGRYDPFCNRQTFDSVPCIGTLCLIICHDLCTGNVCRIIFAVCEFSHMFEQDIINVQSTISFHYQ